MNFSFAGCGFLGIYHVGVSACLKKYAPDLLVKKISGASAGSLAAAALLCDCPLGTITSSVLKTATEARKHLLGPFHPTFNIEDLLRNGLFQVLPENAHELVNGKLFISVTRVVDGKNVLLSHFKTREDLIQALLCSAFIPAFSGWKALEIDGVRYVDGGFTNNLPQIDENTITVSPFCGEADICPKDNNAGLLTVCLANTSIELSQENLYRFVKILFPPSPSVLSRMCQQGFNDTLEFLQRNRLISCTQCLAIQSTFSMPKDEPEIQVGPHCQGYNENCPDCKIQRHEALLDTLPETVGTIFKEAIDTANSGLYEWVIRQRAKGILHTVLLFPWHLGWAITTRIMMTIPTLSDPRQLALQMVEIAQALINSWGQFSSTTLHSHHARHHHEKSFTCQLNITEFGEAEPNSVYNKANYSLDMDKDNLSPAQFNRDSLSLESELLSQIATRCAAKSISHHTSRVPSRNPSRAPSKAPSRAVSRAVSRRQSIDDDIVSDISDWDDMGSQFRMDDAFDKILHVTSGQEALMAYYYLDDNNQVKVTEIFDLSKTLVREPTLGDVDTRPLSESQLRSHLDSDNDDEQLHRRSPGSPGSNNSELQSDPEAERYINV